MITLRWACRVTRRDHILIEHTRAVQENYRKTTQVVRPCDEDERGAHSEKNARCGHTRDEKRVAKPICGNMHVRELLDDTGEAGRGQHIATYRAA